MSRTVGRKLSTVIDPRQSPTRPESSESIASTCSDETSQINDTNEEMSSPSPSYTNYAICSKDNLIQYSEDELQTIYNEAITKFNLKPKSLRDYLASKRVIQGLPSEIAAFLHEQTKLSKRRVGEYIGQQDNFNQKVCEELFARYNFAGMTLDNALRVLTRQFRLPGEAQQIDRILEKFANAYHQQNEGVFLSADTAYILAFSIIMLNTDLHNQSITPEKKMKLEEFIRNNRGINQGKDVDRKLLEELYYSIKNNEIRMDDTDMYESEVIAFMAPTKSGWLEKKAESMLPIWKRHWFVLNDGCLYYFIAPSDEGPRCIIPLDNTRIGRGYGQLEFIIASATGDYVKSSKLLEDGRMEQGKHTQFVLRATSAEDREAWVTILQQESMRFKPLHEIFLRRSEQDPNMAEKPLELPSPIAEGWMRKRGGLNPAWKRRYFVLYPDFDGGGNTLFYYVSHQVRIAYLERVF